MNTKPTRESIRGLIMAMCSSTESRIPSRTDFAVTAILCQVNEGVEPHIVAELPYKAFNFAEKWIEFISCNGEVAVRRRLSDETAEYLERKMRQSGAGPDDLVCSYRAAEREGRKRAAKPSFGQLVRKEVRFAGFIAEEFSPTRLRWVWVDENPDIRNEERRARILAKFILRWASAFQQEALLRRAYDKLPILRPSWAYPTWHKAALKDSHAQEEDAATMPRTEDQNGSEMPDAGAGI